MSGKSSAKIEQTSSSGGAKVSMMFAKKPGFVIPKNKLLGSFVPVARGTRKPSGADAAPLPNEDSINQLQRKTKWAPDLSQDAAVRKARALAYQTRVDQIAQKLKLGSLEPGENQDSQVADGIDPESSSSQAEAKTSELLELERREAIGEILKLNPTYKAPPDYIPLLKEDRVSIPVKEHPGYNFVGLIFGPGRENQKQLEKETGAKIQLYGTRTNTGEKIEISPSDGNDATVAYEELSVHISAETYEKVDAAVAVIEMLVTTVTGNLATGDVANVSQSQDASAPVVLTAVNQGLVLPLTGSVQTPQNGQYLYQSPWLSAVPPPSGLNPHHNASEPMLNDPVHVSSSSLNASNMPSLFSSQPAPASGFNSVLQNPSLLPARPHLPAQILPNPYPSRNFSMPAPHPTSVQANVSTSLPFADGQHPLIEPFSVARPLMASLPQPVSSVPPAPQMQPDRPLVHVGSSSGWSGAPAGVLASMGPGNVGQMASPIIPSQGPPPVGPHPGFPSSAPHPAGLPGFPSVLPTQRATSSTPILSSMMSASQPAPQSYSGATVNSTPTRPPMATAPTSQRPATGDFIFRPHNLQTPHSPAFPVLSSQPVNQNTLHPRPMMQTPAMPNSAPQPGMHMLPRPQFGNQMGQTLAHMSAVPFAGNPSGNSVPPRPMAFSNAHPNAMPHPIGQMGPRTFNPAPQPPNMAGPFPPRTGNTLQLQQNYPAPMNPRGNFMAPSPRFNPFASTGRPSPGSGGQQTYDPFSPTSAAAMPQQQGGNPGKGRKLENDPEYEDLMASVGVK